MQAVREPVEQSLGRKEFDASRCQFNRQWQSIQANADGSNETGILRGEVERWKHRLCSLYKEVNCRILDKGIFCWKRCKIGQCQWQCRKLVFPLYAQNRATGHQELDAWTGDQELLKLKSCFYEVFNVIQDQQELFILYVALYS